MRFKSFLLNFFIGWLTFTIGISWLGFYQFFVPVQTEIESVKAEPSSMSPSERSNSGLKIEKDEDIKNTANKAAGVVKEAALKAVEESAFTSFSFSGAYEIDDSTYKPFKEFKEMELHFAGADSQRIDYLIGPPVGHFKTNKSFKFEKVLLAQRELFFSTNTLGGVSYEYSGAFGLDPNDPSPSKEPVLIGALMKIKNGKIVKRYEITFRKIEGC